MDSPNRIKARAAELGISIRALALRVGCAPGRMSRVAAGYQEPKARGAIAIATALRTDVEDLWATNPSVSPSAVRRRLAYLLHHVERCRTAGRDEELGEAVRALFLAQDKLRADGEDARITPQSALDSVERVLQAGATKHGRTGWETRHSDPERVQADIDSVRRHLAALEADLRAPDAETGEPHAAHAAARLLLLLATALS